MSQASTLVISQVYPPDPTSVGQHMRDAAAALSKRGATVRVFTSDRGYNDPSVKYPKREMLDGVDVVRLPFSSLGKKTIVHRLVAQTMFLLQATLRGLFMPGLDCILISTSPPMSSAAAWVITTFRRRVKITYWVMDINPDQLIEMGLIKPTSLLVKLFDWFNRSVLRRAANVITLDRFMAERVLRKLDVRNKLTVAPPWPHQSHLELVEHTVNPFRREHELDGRFVIMYSGNHSVFTPLRTILDAAIRLRDQERLRFMFIGGGTGKPEVDQAIAEHKLTHVTSLPYQPLDQIKYSLSAGDVHLVVLGDSEVGVRHPCKIYSAMALGKPVLFLGPDPCHVSDLLRDLRIGWHIRHGQVDEAVEVIQQILETDPAELAEMGQRARREVESALSMEKLLADFCDLVEQSQQQ